jgi:hypothetical protein
VNDYTGKFTGASAILATARISIGVTLFGSTVNTLEILFDSQPQWSAVSREFEIHTDRIGGRPVLQLGVRNFYPNHSSLELHVRTPGSHRPQSIGKFGVARKMYVLSKGLAGGQTFHFAPIYPQTKAVVTKSQLHLFRV